MTVAVWQTGRDGHYTRAMQSGFEETILFDEYGDHHSGFWDMRNAGEVSGGVGAGVGGGVGARAGVGAGVGVGVGAVAYVCAGAGGTRQGGAGGQVQIDSLYDV